MMSIIDRIPMQTLVVLALFLGLAPFVPEPHIWQKLKMLAAGQLSQLIDIVDLLFHAAPSVLVAIKLWRKRAAQ